MGDEIARRAEQLREQADNRRKAERENLLREEWTPEKWDALPEAPPLVIQNRDPGDETDNARP